MHYSVIIPARYGSSRFPGKPLALIKDKPMIQHVFERAVEAGANQIIVATDDERIEKVALSFGANVCMTSSEHESGTTRIAEVIERSDISDDEIIINVQGDEPFIPAQNIRQVAHNLHEHQGLPMATLAYPISNTDDLFNPNVVKVVTNANNVAMYFSRFAVPFDRNQFMHQTGDKVDFEKLSTEYLRHIGIYGYRAGFVKDYAQMPTTALEQIESLEQLRVLWHGHSIHVDIASQPPPHGVDTPEDLAKLNEG